MVLRQRSEKRKQLNWIREPDEQSSAECLHSSHDKTDYWRIDSERRWVERVHRRPRWERFTPIGVGECPVDFKEFGFSSGRRQIYEDIWVGTHAHDREVESWTGVTRFSLEPPKAAAALLTI